MPPAYLRGPDVPRIKYWGCTGKATFGSEAMARRAAGQSGHHGLTPYRCAVCTGWHNTSRKLNADERAMRLVALRCVGVRV